MRIKLWTIPIVSLILFFGNDNGVQAAEQLALPIDASGKISPPENTECKRLVYDNSSNKKRAKTPSNGMGTLELYDICIGTYPKYPSTSAESGIKPIYYAKYYFFPEPMPYYKNITYDGVTAAGTTVRGLDQKVTFNNIYEKRDEPSHNDIFIFYPYDKEHATINPLPQPTVNGPYQVGYNSFYHNTYRARYFASEVNFTFELLEPKEGAMHLSKFEGKTYEDKTVLFIGEIYYKLEDDPTSPDYCYETQYLDYTDACRSIEFYFPKGDKTTQSFTTTSGKSAVKETGWRNGELKNSSDTMASPDDKAINVVPKDRISYRNPGEHIMLFYAEENVQLRLQKDLGTEYQTKGNKLDVQNVKPIEDTIRYFTRNDVDINGDPITPITNITKVYNENYRKTGLNYEVILHNGKSTASSSYAITNLSAGHYEYEWQQDYLNYCTKDTDVWGAENTNYRTNNTDGGTNQTDLSQQRDKTCYHNEGKEHHFWQYSWGNTGWYANSPDLGKGNVTWK